MDLSNVLNAFNTSLRSRLTFIIARGADMCLMANRDVDRYYPARLRQQHSLVIGYADLLVGLDRSAWV